VRLDQVTKLIDIYKIQRRFNYFEYFDNDVDPCIQIKGRKSISPQRIGYKLTAQ